MKIGTGAVDTLQVKDGVTKGISIKMEDNRYISFGHYTGGSTGYTPMVVMNPGTAMAGVPVDMHGWNLLRVGNQLHLTERTADGLINLNGRVATRDFSFIDFEALDSSAK